MSRLLAIDWDAREVRFVLAARRGRELRVDAVGRAPLESPTDGENGASPAPGESLSTALASLKLGRVQTVVGLSRAGIELLELTLPPAQDAELPELVRNQSMRESSLVSEDWLLDFVPLDADPGAPRRVLAAAISAEQLERIRQGCTRAGVMPSRVVLRPYATASLFRRVAPHAPRVSMLVSRLPEEADLIVLVDGRVMFWRTVRLPGDSGEEAASRRLVAEIARTSVVVRNQPGCGPIEGIVALGGAQEHAVLVALAPQQLPLPIGVVDPFAALGVEAAKVPADAGRYAALLGMLADEARGEPPAVDFLHPRRRPAPPNRRRRLAIAAAVAACVVGAFGYSTWSRFAEVNEENELLAAQLKDLDELAKQAAQRQKVAQAVRQWNAGDVVWLDELRDLSWRFPKSRDAVVLRMSLVHARAGGGTMDLVGVVRDPAVVGRMERSLRDEFHEVRSKGVKERVEDTGFSWEFESSVSVAHREKDQYKIPSPPSGEGGGGKSGAAARFAPGKAANAIPGG